MLAVTRKSEIKDIVLEKKSVTVTELAKIFSVTEETIRRDLKQLESEGFLTRTYGGAFIQDGVENNIDLSIRETAYLKNKQAIASRCRELIHNGDSIFLDSSTTTLTIAKAISDMRLTVVTNSLMIINELCDKANIHLIAIGGQLYSEGKSFQRPQHPGLSGNLLSGQDLHVLPQPVHGARNHRFPGIRGRHPPVLSPAEQGSVSGGRFFEI